MIELSQVGTGSDEMMVTCRQAVAERFSALAAESMTIEHEDDGPRAVVHVYRGLVIAIDAKYVCARRIRPKKPWLKISRMSVKHYGLDGALARVAESVLGLEWSQACVDVLDARETEQRIERLKERLVSQRKAARRSARHLEMMKTFLGRADDFHVDELP